MDATEVKPGYKVTELGVIPEDWEVIQLGDISSYLSSGKSRVTNLTAGYPVYGSTGLISFSNSFDYKGNAILIARVGANAGKLNLVTAEYNVTDNTIILKLDNNSDLKFFFYYLDLFNLNSLIFGSGQPLITGSLLKQITIPLPPLPEQKAIAGALSDVDALITAQEALIAKKRDIKTATMQQLLTGKLRLGDFGQRAGATATASVDGVPPGYQVTELGMMPEDWEVIQLGDISSYLSSGKSRVTNLTAGYPVYGSTGLISFSNSFDYKGNAILIARVGANAGKLNLVTAEYNVTDNTIILKLDNNSDLKFFFYYLDLFNLNSLIFGSGQPLITGSLLKQITIPLPPLSEQKSIASVLSDMEAEITALEAQRDKTKAIKQGMMQQLLTGKTCLGVAS